MTVSDTTPPAITCPQASSVSMGDGCRGAIPDLLANLVATDNCSSPASLLKTQNPAAGTPVGAGSHIVEVTVTDETGNRSLCLTSVSAHDTVAPVITAITANPGQLWPPNHHMVKINLVVSVVDNCDPAPLCRIVSIQSNEPVTGPGDQTCPDSSITGPLSANLRSEKANDDFARLYTLTVECTDSAGNRSTATVAIPVVKQVEESYLRIEKTRLQKPANRRQKENSNKRR